MRQLRAWVVRLGGLFRRQQRDRELAAELESHLRMHVEDNLRLGMSPEEARRQALLKLGGMEQTKELYRERRSLPALESLVQDLRFGARALARSPGFTLVAVLTLALGIGANAAIFSAVRKLILNPFPYPEAHELTWVGKLTPQQEVAEFVLSGAEVADLQAQEALFERVAATRALSMNMTSPGEPERLRLLQVTPEFFPLLGARPLVGQLPDPGARVNWHSVMLSHGFWQRRFGGDPSLVGRGLVLEGVSFTVTAVLPPEFRYGDVDLWQPIALDSSEARRGRAEYTALARLRDGVDAKQAAASLEVLARRWEDAYGGAYPQYQGVRVEARPLADVLMGKVQTTLVVLQVAVVLVLLIACVNVMNLLLARAAGRQRELAIRLALGGGRARVVRLLVVESMLLALAGGAAGLVLAAWGVYLLAKLIPVRLVPAEVVSGLALDANVLWVTALVALATGLVCGIWPAVGTVRAVNLARALAEGSRTASPGLGRRHMGRALVAAEVAVSLVLLIGAGLMVRTFQKLWSINPGFDPSNVITLRMALLDDRYGSPDQIVAFLRRVLERLEAVPGVEAVGIASEVPPGRSRVSTVSLEEIVPGAAPVAETVTYRAVSPDYFRAMRIRLVQGRFFEMRDDAAAPRVAIVNRALARRLWPGADPVGQPLKVGRSVATAVEFRVVGVVEDAIQTSLDAAARPEICVPILQRPLPDVALVVRAQSDPAAAVAEVRRAIRGLDPEQPVYEVERLTQRMAESLGAYRLGLVLLGMFAALALVLATVGTYGVMAYTVTQRTREVGIRMALGAQPADILRLFLGNGLRPVGAGVALGLIAAWISTRLMSALLFGVAPTDAVTFAGVSTLLVVVALLACWMPARRATGVDPVVVLRYE